MDATLTDVSLLLPPGAAYVPQFIPSTQALDLVDLLDGSVWSGELRRRVQHFGYRYDYKARAVTSDAYLGHLPFGFRPWGSIWSRRVISMNCLIR